MCSLVFVFFSFCHEFSSHAQLSVHINGRKMKVYLVYRYLMEGILWVVSPWLGRLLQGLHFQRRCRQEGRLPPRAGGGQAGRPSSCLLGRPSWRGSLSLSEPDIHVTCGNPDSPLLPLHSRSSSQTLSWSRPQADQSLSLGTSQSVTRLFHVYLNRKRGPEQPLLI